MRGITRMAALGTAAVAALVVALGVGIAQAGVIQTPSSATLPTGVPTGLPTGVPTGLPTGAPAPVTVTLMFSGTGADTTADAAKAKAVASAKAQEQSFAMQFHATCTDTGTTSQAWPAGPDRFIATATITASCMVPPPAAPTS